MGQKNSKEEDETGPEKHEVEHSSMPFQQLDVTQKHIPIVPIQQPQGIEQSEEFNESRLTEIIHGLQRLAWLQDQVMSAQVDAREKRKEAAIKRRVVWLQDAAFMRRVQELEAQGVLAAREDLKATIEASQGARDLLGPVEQEGIEAELRYEGRMWELQQAQDRFIGKFREQFKIPKSDPAGLSSAESSEYHPPSEDERSIGTQSSVEPSTFHRKVSRSISSSTGFNFDHSEIVFQEQGNRETHDEMLRGLNIPDPGYCPEQEGNLGTGTDSDSGFGDIDKAYEESFRNNFMAGPMELPDQQYSSIDLYPELITDFRSTRDRINRWLQEMVLGSRIESTSLFTILKDKFEKENTGLPSNWAQLVVSYWYMYGADSPYATQREGHSKEAFQRMKNTRGECKDHIGPSNSVSSGPEEEA